MRGLFIFLLIACMGFPAQAETPSEAAKIRYLLYQLGAADITFIRDGEQHDGAWAKEHLADKLRRANKPGMTAEEFIDRIAGRNSDTKKSYFIKLPDGTIVKSKDWLRARLKQMPVD